MPSSAAQEQDSHNDRSTSKVTPEHFSTAVQIPTKKGRKNGVAKPSSGAVASVIYKSKMA